MQKYFFLIVLFFCFVKATGQILYKPVPDKLVVLTFDDAPASQYSYVAPLLKKYGFGATFFVCEFPPNFNDSSKYMNWGQIQQLSQMGFEIANHTHTHASVSHLSSVEFINELKYIEAKCDSLKIDKTTSFAYPNYDIDTNALRMLGQCGYQFARAGGSRVYNPLKDHPYLVPSWATDDKNRLEIFDALQLASNGNIVVLTIHGVPDIEHPWVTTAPSLFAEYLEFLHKNSFKVIALKQLAEYINIKKALHDIKPGFKNQLKN